jgi:hypothetical protein
MKPKAFIILFSIIIILFLGGRYIYYGSLTASCIYTENNIPIPKKLSKGDFVIAKDAYLAIGINAEYSCLQNFGNIDREIVGSETINNITIGRKYFTNRGIFVKSLKKGSSFRLTDIIAITKHGLSTIDSGPGPLFYLILKDQNNISYQIATVSLGLNKKDLFLSFIDSSQSVNASSAKLLSADSFSEGDGKSLNYTGELTTLSYRYLESTEPNWKKLEDRLELNEKFFIHIEIALRDDSFREIKLSENQEVRYKQIEKIQNEFLSKIPKNIRLVNLEKEKAWPYISIEANLNLLNYLIDEQVYLKIKMVSELIKN